MSKYKPQIAIIIPTILRDDLLMQTINSIVDVWEDDWKVFIIDQNLPETYSEEKRIFYETACSDFHNLDEQRIQVIRMPFDAGISACRNKGVEYASRLRIPYCFIGADSIKFDESMKNLIKLKHYMPKFDIIGCDISNRIGWEGKLKLYKESHFEIDFIDTKKCKECAKGKLVIFKCDIVRNFFLARTNALTKIRWDFNLKCMEHEDFFIRFKWSNHKVGCTKYCKGEYIGEESKRDNSEYARLRRRNMDVCRQKLMEKYKLKKWIAYKNLERVK